MQAEIREKKIILRGPFTPENVRFISTFAGAKKWIGPKEIEVIANAYNTGLLISAGIETSVPFADPNAEKLAETSNGITWKYRPNQLLRSFQNECLDLSWNKPEYAVFAEMGLGKTAIEIANIGLLATADKISGALVIAPNGVHEQWLQEEWPKHADPRLRANLYVWQGKPLPWIANERHVEVLAMNVDSLRLKREKVNGRWQVTHISEGFKFAEKFIERHNGRVLMIVDESHLIKSLKSQRTKAAFVLRKMCAYARILTGTPISRNLEDAFAQFQFLNPRIIGYTSVVAFRSHFCILGGYANKEIIGAQNVEEFYSIIAPYTYRKTKAEVTDLPPKIYVRRKYVMSEDTKRHYESMKKAWLTRFDSGEIKDAKNGIVAMLRMQQILCGFLENEAGEKEEIGSGERLDAMVEIIDQTEGQTIIWARFTHDIEAIADCLRRLYGHEEVVTYYGEMSDAERRDAKAAFKAGGPRFFVGNVGISAGLDGLQGARTMIFYSRDFNAIHDWQAQDRAHRFGMTSLTIFFLIAKNSIDYAIDRNLSDKKSLSDLTLDQIRQAICEM